MKSNIKRNLLVGFGISLFLLLISSVASYNSIQHLLESARLVNHTDSVIERLETVLSTLKDAETGQRGYLLTGREHFLEPYNGSYEKAQHTLNDVKMLTADNPRQQRSCAEMQQALSKRLFMLSALIDARRANQPIDPEQLENGRKYMDEIRGLVKTMEDRERMLLNERNEGMKRYATFTPILIFVAALLSIIITIIFFAKVNSDIEKRAQLQKELEDKDAEITRRIDIIQRLADKIAGGDYAIRVSDAERDGLGILSGSLNKMAESLEVSFTALSHKEWLQTGVAALNERMIGEQDLERLADNIIKHVAEYTNSQVGAFYLLDGDADLRLHSGYAFAPGDKQNIIRIGAGIAGQCAADGKQIVIKDIEQDAITISYATGAIRPRNIIAIPLLHENKVNGVMELGTVHEYSDVAVEYLTVVAGQIGIAINSAQNRKKLQELLEETQAQSEELQTQQNELEELNRQLEIQTESLQTSEEELKVQQEELQQANEELEERTTLLEEKNQMIVERNKEIQAKAEELQLSTKYKSEFLANMSHELRTPLNSILLLSRLLSENNERNLNEEQVESANVIQSSGKGLLSLIDEILDLSKIESGKMDVEYAQVSVSDIADDMRSLFAPVARSKNVELLINTDGDVPPAIETDKQRLEQVLKNLLSNALKFTARGSVQLKISTVNGRQPMVRFSVKDTGIGIPKEKHALIFEAFQQADGSTKRKFGGTGLGLSISREISRLLGGEISLESVPGEGSEFTITIPVWKPDGTISLADDFLVARAAADINVAVGTTLVPDKRFTVPQIPSEIPDDRDSIRMDDKVVLIIEDDTNFAGSLLRFTRSKGYKGVVIVRGDHVAAAAEQYKPVAILLDIQLPVKDGWQVMKEIKENAATRHIPVHMMSSLNARKESLQSGAVDFINKPIALEQMQEIFSKLEDALNRHPKKVLIVEENIKHAQALAYFLESFNVNAEIKTGVEDSITSLKKNDVDCVILDMGVPGKKAYEALESVKKVPGFENLPIIIFTGKQLSRTEEGRIKQYADSIVLKTAHSYQRILDEVALFLHLVEEHQQPDTAPKYKKLGALDEVLKGKTVLVADDDVRNIFSITKALEQHGMKVVTAIDGKEAFNTLRENAEVDIVLMDIMMPEMDGYEAIKKIRQVAKYKQLPVLAVTAKAMLGDREKCIAAGASDYISKPIDIDQLLSLLRVWLYDNSNK